MMMERERDGHGGGGAAVPLSSDDMDLRSVCDSFHGVSPAYAGSVVNYIWVPSRKFHGLT
jgi:hypothetical protein